MTCLDEMIIALAPKHVPRHDALFGKGRGRLGYLIYNRLTGHDEVDELDFLVERIKTYFEKSKSFLKRGLARRALNYIFRRKETPKQYLNKAAIGFMVTERLSFYSDREVSPSNSMKTLNANPITIGSIQSDLETKDFEIDLHNKSTIYTKALKKKVSYVINKFANAVKYS